MLNLFLVPPAGLGSECWIKSGIVGCYCSSPKRGPFYVSQVFSRETSVGKILWQLGVEVANFGVPGRGPTRGYAAKRLYDRMQLTDVTGIEPVGQGVLAAKALLKSITFNLVDDDQGIRKGCDGKHLIVGLGYLCNPDLFAQRAVFLAGYWSVV